MLMLVLLSTLGFVFSQTSCDELHLLQSDFCLSKYKLAIENEEPCIDRCSEQECCQDPESCVDAETLYPISMQAQLCGPLEQVVKTEGICKGRACNSSSACCSAPTTCLGYDGVLGGLGFLSCRERDQMFNYDAVCSGGRCTLDVCCRPMNCQEYLYYVNPYLCTTSQFPISPAPLCNGECTNTQCCRRPLTCQEASTSSPVFQQAGGCERGKILGPDVNCTACNLNECCVTPRTCAEMKESDPSFCMNSNKRVFAGERETFNVACPSGSCNAARCCRIPQTCEEQNEADPGFRAVCEARELIVSTASDSSCGRECNRTDVCCATPKTCSDIREMNRKPQDFCVNKTWNDEESLFGDCLNGKCEERYCCHVPNTCAEIQGVLEGQDLNALWCVPLGLVFDENVDCASGSSTGSSSNVVSGASMCNAKVCCTPINTCRKLFSKTPSVCNAAGQIFIEDESVLDKLCPSNINGGVCTTQTCCSPPANCGVANQLIPIPCAQQQRILSTTTSCFPNCNTNRCCRNPTSCPEFLGVNNLYCLLIGQTDNLNGGVCNGECDARQCCVPASNCAEIDRVNGFRLCYNRGKLDGFRPCVGGNCSAETCCQPPPTCSDIHIVTSLFPPCCVTPPCRGCETPGETTWCSRNGLNERFSGSTCASGSGISASNVCSSSRCCSLPTSCEDWQHVYRKNNPKTATDICRSSLGVFNVNGECDGVNALCSEQTCCRAPLTCQEAGFQFLCNSVGGYKRDQPCSGSSCNVSTCCFVPQTCDEANTDWFFCGSQGLIPRSDLSAPCVNNNSAIDRSSGRSICTTAQCCDVPLTCAEAELRVFQCPASSQVDGFKPCRGTACTSEVCCMQVVNCYDLISLNPLFCSKNSYGFVNSNASFSLCGPTGCTQAQCCRSTPNTCGEALEQSPSLCNGVVDYFKPCSFSPLSSCASSSFCCREPVNCKEAQQAGKIVCDAKSNQVLSNPFLPCPASSSTSAGGCQASLCCKSVSNCEEMNLMLNNSLCANKNKNSIVKTSTPCTNSASSPCSTSVCCRSPSTCREATTSNTSFCSGTTPIVSVQALNSICGPNCQPRECCRSSSSCVEAFFNDRAFCERNNKVFNTTAASLSCTNCNMQCCISDVTFAPTTQQQRAISRPPTPNYGVRSGCPRDEFEAFVMHCTNLDFTRSCSSVCQEVTQTLREEFSYFNTSLARTCLDEASTAPFEFEIRNYISNQLQTGSELCRVPYSASFSLGYSLLTLGVSLFVILC